MSGRYSLNTFGNIIKYDYIRSNIGIGNAPDIYAKIKINSVGSGETTDLWIASLFGGNNENLHKIAIGTINSNSCIGAVDNTYNFTDLYLNSDGSYNNSGNIYILGNLYTSNNVFIYSNLNVNGTIGVGKNPSSSTRLDINGLGNGINYNNWVSTSIGCSDSNLNRIAFGIINSNAIIGSVDGNNSNRWKPLIINGDGNGNGCNVVIDTNLYVTSNLSIINGNILVNTGPSYSNTIFIGNNKTLPSINCYNNFSKDYDILYLNCDKNSGNDVIIRQNLFVNTNINIKGSLNVNKIITSDVNGWINSTFSTSNIYDLTIIGTLNSNSVIGSIANDYSSWKPLYLNGDNLSGKGSDVYIVNSLKVNSNINILNQNYGIGIGTSFTSNKFHIYNSVSNDAGIVIENKNTLAKSLASIKMYNDTNNSFNIYLNSSIGGINTSNTSNNAAVIINTCGNLYLQTKNNKGITISDDSSIYLDANLTVNSNVGIKMSPSSSNNLAIYGNIGLFDTSPNSTYNYNISTDKLYSNLTWILPNRYPNSRELFTYNTLSGKLDWINIANFSIDYWNVGNSNYTGYLTITQEYSNILYQNNFKIGFKSSNISIGNYIYRRYPKNIYTNTNISYNFTDINYSSFSQSDITFANNNRIFIKYDTASYGFNLIRTGVIIKKYRLYSSNIINNNLTDIENYFNLTTTPYTYDIINSTNAINFSSATNYVTEISFLFIPTISTNYVFTINSQYYYGTLHIDTINSSDGSYSTTNAKYPYFFDYSNNTGTTNILLPAGEVFGNSITSFNANSIYRILIRLVHLSNNTNVQLWYTNNTNSLQLNNIFNDTTNSIYYKLTNSRCAINFPSTDYVANSTYNINALLINDIADNYYYSSKYLTNYSNLLNPNNNNYWVTDKIFSANGNIDTSVIYYGIKDTTIGVGSFNMSGFSKDGNTYTLASYGYNPVSQNISSSYGTTIIYSFPTNIKLVTYGILVSTDLNAAPSKWQLYGSVSGLTNTATNNYWDLLDDRTATYNDFKTNNITYFIPNNANIKNYYKYFAIVVSAIIGNSKQLSIGSLIFNGIDSTYSVDSNGNVSDASYFNDILALNYQGDIGLGISNPKYKLDVAGNINSYNLHTSGYIMSDNDITTSSSIYSSNLTVYGDINTTNGLIASTIWGELHGKAYLYTPNIYGNTYLDGNIYITSNVGIGTSAFTNIRLDINSVGTGLNNIDWVGARIGGSITSNSLVLGTINNYPSVGALNETTNNWTDLLLNGDNNGNGGRVIVGTNLKINSNLYVSSNIEVGSNIFVNSNVGIGRNPNTNYRFDVNSYGTGNDNKMWACARFGGTVSANRVVIGALSNYATIGALTDNGTWTDLLLNGDNNGTSGRVYVSGDLKINSNLYVGSNFELASNLSIGKTTNGNYRLDVNSYGTGINNIAWPAARFGGILSSNRVVVGTINNNACIGAINENTGNWGELLLNGDRNGGGSNVIISTNLFVNSNIQVTSNISIGRTINANIPLDVSSYGSGSNTTNWVAGRFGGSSSLNNVVIGSINNIPCIGGNNNNNNWTPIILNGDGYGNGANVSIGTNLIIGSDINVNCNIYVGESAIIGTTVGSGKKLKIYGNITTYGNDVNNGLITSSGGISVTGGNILLSSTGGLTVLGGTGANISGSANTLTSTTTNTLSATTNNVIIGVNNYLSGTNNFLSGITSNCITAPNTSVIGNLTIYPGSASGNLVVAGAITGNSTMTINGATTLNNSITINGLVQIKSNGLIADNSIVCNGLSSSGGLSIVGATNLSAGTNTNLISSSTSTTITGPLIISGSTTTNITNTTSFSLTSPTTSIESLVNIGTNSGVGAAGGGAVGTLVVGSATYSSKSVIVYGNIEARGTADGNNGKIIAANGLTMSAGDFTVSVGNLNVTSGSATIGNNVTIGSTSAPDKNLTIYGNIITNKYGLSDGKITVANGLTVLSGTNSITCTSGGTNTLSAPSGTNNITSTNINLTATTNTFTGTTNTAVVGPLSVSDLLTATGGVTTPLNLATTGSGSISSAGALTITGTTTLNGATNINNTLTVTGTSSFNGGFSVAGNFSTTSSGTITSSGTMTSGGLLTVSTGGLTVSSGNLNISSGTTTLNGNVTVGNSSTLTVAGLTTATGGVTTPANLVTTGSGSITSATTIVSSGAITSGGALTVSTGGITVTSGASTINGNVTIQNSGTLTVAGLTTASGGVTTAGNIVTTGTGTITSGGKLTASASMEVSSGTFTTISGVTSTLNGNVTIGNSGTLTVAGLTTCSGGLTVTGATTLANVTTGAITANGQITANNGITMPGTITAGTVTTTGSGAITAGGAISAGTTITSAGNASIGGNTTVTGTTSLGGNTTVKGGSLGCTLSVTGTIGATSDIGLVSDERLKTDIITIDNALEKVNKLRGVYYKRNKILDKDENIDRVHIGLIAQEVEKIIPESVIINEESKEKYRSVIYQNMVGLLIEAIKELDINYTKKINDLNDRISVLENGNLL